MAGVPTADWAMAPANRDRVAKEFGWPVVVKPSKQGSTVGLTVVKRAEDYQEAVTLARRYDDEVMFVRFRFGRVLLKITDCRLLLRTCDPVIGNPQ